MTRTTSGWLETLARRAARPTAGTTPADPSPLPTEDQAPGGPGALDARYPRNTVLKLALAAAATVSLGLGRAMPARADDRGKCFEQCVDSHDQALKSQLAACAAVFEPRSLVGTKPNSWARDRAALRYGGMLFWYGLAGAMAADLCYQKAERNNNASKRACYTRCEKQAKPSPPPKTVPPTVPPIPISPTTAACAGCEAVGGHCCGPYSDKNPLCACATAGVPCAKYGCEG